MKKAGMLIIIIGLILTLGILIVRPADMVYNWSPVNGMIIMGIGSMVYIAGLKIRISEEFPNPEKQKQYDL